MLIEEITNKIKTKQLKKVLINIYRTNKKILQFKSLHKLQFTSCIFKRVIKIKILINK